MYIVYIIGSPHYSLTAHYSVTVLKMPDDKML